jgi:hypothetical protein
MKGIMGCCLTVLIVLVVIIGLVFGGVWYVSNMTLGELGLSETPLIGDKTVAELGLTDVKIKDIFTFLKGLSEGANEDDIVNNPFTEADLNSLETKLTGSNIIDPITGDIDLENLEGGYVVFSSSDPITITDTELAAFFNMLIQEGFESNEDNQEEMADGEEETDLRISICEVTLTVPEGNTGATIRTVIKFDISGLELPSDIPSQIQGYIPQAIYIATVSNITAGADGKIAHLGEDTVTINNIPNSITDPFLLFLANVIASENEDLTGIDGQPIEPDEGFFAEMVCGLFARLIYSFGLVGQSDSDLGNSGFEAITATTGQVTIVPWTVDTVPTDESYMSSAYETQATAEANKAYIIAKYVNDAKYYGEPAFADMDTVTEFINYLNSQGITCQSGTAAVQDATVINVGYSGSFDIEAVYAKYGSSTVTCTGYGLFDVVNDEEYDFETIARADLDASVVRSLSSEAKFASFALAYYDYKEVYDVAENDVDAFVSELATRFHVTVSIGVDYPAENGVNTSIIYTGTMYNAVGANYYASYGYAQYNDHFSVV